MNKQITTDIITSTLCFLIMQLTTFLAVVLAIQVLAQKQTLPQVVALTLSRIHLRLIPLDSK